MSDFLDIGSLIEQTVQEVLGEKSKASDLEAKPVAHGEGKPVFRIGPTRGDISLQKTDIPDLGLIADRDSVEFTAEPSDAPEHARPVQRGSFAANLWSGPSFFSQQILKKKAVSQ